MTANWEVIGRRKEHYEEFLDLLELEADEGSSLICLVEVVTTTPQWPARGSESGLTPSEGVLVPRGVVCD